MRSTLITAENLRVTAEGGNDIIIAENLRIENGFTAIIGPSGSGKTTLLNALSGLKYISEGTINHYDTKGNVIFQHTKESVAENIKGSFFINTNRDKIVDRYRSDKTGYIPQSPYLDPLLTPSQQLLTNHAIRGHKLDEQYVKLLSKTLGIEDIFKPISPRHFKKGTFSKVLENLGFSIPKERLCNVLSGGEKQRLATVIALAHKPEIVFADEPTSALDTKHKKPLYDLLRQTVDEGGHSVIVVSHDNNIADFADNVVKVEDGNIAEIQNNIRNLSTPRFDPVDPRPSSTHH